MQSNATTSQTTISNESQLKLAKLKLKVSQTLNFLQGCWIGLQHNCFCFCWNYIFKKVLNAWLFSFYFLVCSKIPAFLNVVDIAGLVKGAHAGQGLGNAFLSHISACDGIFHMTRESQVEGCSPRYDFISSTNHSILYFSWSSCIGNIWSHKIGPVPSFWKQRP